MKDDLLAAYLICHYNWQIDFLRPTIEEIVAEYLKAHDPDPRRTTSRSDDECEEGASGQRRHG